MQHNIDSQPLKIPPEEDCKVEICLGLTKDNTDKDATFLPFFLFKSTTPTHVPPPRSSTHETIWPSDVLYTHLNALICQNKNGGGGPITYHLLYYTVGLTTINIHQNIFNIKV